jgi:hypothetical protein
MGSCSAPRPKGNAMIGREEDMGGIEEARDREVQFCVSLFFCYTPLQCIHECECRKPGEAIAFNDRALEGLGQPSTREQWRMSDAAMIEAAPPAGEK